jgi:hypothetical protein
MRMGVLPLLAALVLGAATAFLVACGDDGRIPSSDASSLENALDQVSADFDAGKCEAAQQAITKLNGALVNLPDSVDSRLRSRLRSGITHLDERVAATCSESQTQTQTQTQTQQQTQTETQTDTDTDTDTGTTSTGTTSTGTTSTGTTSTGTTSTGTTGTGTTGTTTGGDTTGGTPPGSGR